MIIACVSRAAVADCARTLGEVLARFKLGSGGRRHSLTGAVDEDCLEAVDGDGAATVGVRAATGPRLDIGVDELLGLA